MAIVRQDEILEKAISSDPSAVPRYNLRAPDGTLIGENIALELANAVTQMGTPVNAAALNEMLAASGITSGSSTAYTLAQEGFSLFDGATVRFRLHAASGAKPTLNVNGTGAKALVDAFGDAMQSEAAAGSWIQATYSKKNDRYVVGIMKYQELPRRPDIIDIISTSDGAYSINIPLDAKYTHYSIDIFDANTSNWEFDVPYEWSLILSGFLTKYFYGFEQKLTYGGGGVGRTPYLNTSASVTTSSCELIKSWQDNGLYAPASIHIDIAIINGNIMASTFIRGVETMNRSQSYTFEKTMQIHKPTIAGLKLTWARPSNIPGSYVNSYVMIIKGEK